MIPQAGRQRPLARGWSRLQDLTVGYGYQPWRAALWLALLLAVGSIVFHISPPAALQPSAAPHFNPVIYTLDLLLPVVNLGKYAFNPAGAEQWFSYALIAAGWLFATTIAACRPGTHQEPKCHIRIPTVRNSHPSHSSGSGEAGRLAG